MAYDRYDRGDGDRGPRGGNEYRGRDEGRSPGPGGERGGGEGAGEDRGFFERARDEVTSWFGDEEAERRRMQDDRSGHPDGDRYERSDRAAYRGQPESGRERGGDRYGGGQGSSYGRGGERDYGARGGTTQGGGESGGLGRSGGDRERPSAAYPGTMNQTVHEPRGGSSGFGGDRGRDDESSGRVRAYRDESRGNGPGRGSGMGGQDYAHAQYGRQEFSQDQGSDRPGAGHDGGSRNQGSPSRGSGGDAHYHQLRQRHIDDLDRDYDDFRREHQSRFESEFAGWRQQRQTKRQMLDSLREDMEVVGSDDGRVGTVDKVRGDLVILNRKDPEAGGKHRSFACTLLDRIEGNRVILNQPAEQAREQLKIEESSDHRGMFGGRSNPDEDRSARLNEGQGVGDGPHILDRSFSGTYEDKKGS